MGGEKELLEKVSGADPRSCDLKDVINQISEIIDPKALNWTVRLGRVIGNNRPSEQLATFLGATTLNALWQDESSSITYPTKVINDLLLIQSKTGSISGFH